MLYAYGCGDVPQINRLYELADDESFAYNDGNYNKAYIRLPITSEFQNMIKVEDDRVLVYNITDGKLEVLSNDLPVIRIKMEAEISY